MDISHRIPPLDDRWALFLDVDGTLIEIAPSPDQVHVDPRVMAAVRLLHARLGGALALVSGREIATLDRLFAPLVLPAAGLHGLERRAASGALERPAGDPAALGEIRAAFAQFAARDPALLVEDKGLSVALHYRNAPGRTSEVLDLAAGLAARHAEGFALQRGKMVIEFRPRGPHKGTVVERFMAEPPFAGRRPVFIGDDITDEDGFRAVNARGGISIRVGGAQTTAAAYRIDSVHRLTLWLGAQAAAASPATSDGNTTA